MPVLGVVALDEVLEVFAPEGVCLEREVLVRPKIVDPELVSPGGFAGFFPVEEEDVGLDTLGVEYAGGKPEQCVDVALVRRRLRRTVSPAPPSKRTLSGTTIAAPPPILSMFLTCWRKLSCLFDVVAQKSCLL